MVPTHDSPSSSRSPSPGGVIERVVILYASETGNAQDAAERVGREFRRHGARCTVLSMDMFDVFQLPDTHLLVLLTSTHGRGDPPPSMKPLWTALLRSSLPRDILEDVNYTIFGLGDSSYERFCFAGKLLARRMQGLGANCVVEPGWGDERAPDGTEQEFLPWMKRTVETMLPYLPTPVAVQSKSSLSLPPPLYEVEAAGPASKLVLFSLDEVSNGHGPIVTAPAREADAINGHGHEPWKPDDWIWARLTHNKRITKEGWWQDVREIELEIENEDFEGYAPGSICNLQPKMSNLEVNDFLDMMDLQQMADKPICVRSLSSDQPFPSHLPPPDAPTTLRSLLTNHFDFRGTPRKSFFEWLRRFSPDEREQERLDEFLADPEEIHTYAIRPARTVLETLADFRQTRLPLPYLPEILPPLRRRQFSIGSSWESHLGKVQLLIALVEYKTNLKAPRQGLCSSWLDSLPVGTRLPIKLSEPTLFLPPNPSTPVILVGPGTGVAPMRAFLEQRLRQGAAKNTALYFGCRSASADLFYGQEWETHRRCGAKVEVAASRDQEEKIYVQHLIKRDKVMINDWLAIKRGHIYISGSSNSMPKEVREAVAWCVSQRGAGSMTDEEATAFVVEMFEDGRGGEESW